MDTASIHATWIVSDDYHNGRFKCLEYQNKPELLSYLKSFADYLVAAKAAMDYVTGKGMQNSLIIYTDDRFLWSNEDIYHLERYNLALNEEFIQAFNDFPIKDFTKIHYRIIGGRKAEIIKALEGEYPSAVAMIAAFSVVRRDLGSDKEIFELLHKRASVDDASRSDMGRYASKEVLECIKNGFADPDARGEFNSRVWRFQFSGYCMSCILRRDEQDDWDSVSSRFPKTDKESEALQEKLENPSFFVLCPRCKVRILFRAAGASAEVKCPCCGVSTGYRGL